jgi:Tol biopolymer transport system component
MPLSVGDWLGPYEILAPIGAGGMGEVYRAHDTKLGRDVAIKVLPAALAQDPERLARFEREAKVLASLNHPNIAGIYGIEDRALVMELVPGESLQGPLPVETALNYAKQIADALEAAHEKNIIHRDLKPANIMVTPAGSVKVLDFGLAAVAQSSDPSNPVNSPTLTISPTRAGVIMGTAAYMSPEQASGKPADKRADIWSFGVVLWELLTGHRLFEGETISHTLADVLRGPIDFDRLPRETPSSICALLRRCLDRNVKNRLRDIGEARIAIEAAMQGVPDKEPVPSSQRPIILWGAAAIAALMSVIAVVAVWRLLHPVATQPRPVVRFNITVPSVALSFGAIALSRDGSSLAFLGGPLHQIYVRTMDQLEARPIPGTSGAWLPCFSPDGHWISYIQLPAAGTSSYALKRIALAGGPPQALVDHLVFTLDYPSTQDWGADDNILFSNAGTLMRIPAAGGKPETLATPDAKKNELSYFGAQLLPGGKKVLMSVAPLSNVFGQDAKLVVLDSPTGEKKILLEHVSGIARYFSTGPSSAVGHIVYYDAGVLMAVAFDARRLETKGSPVPVLAAVQGSGSGTIPLLGISSSGTLAYLVGASSSSAQNTLTWVDRKGVEQPIAAPPRAYVALALSPDGRRIAVGVSASRHDTSVYDLARDTLRNLTSDGGSSDAVWTPDGKRLIYAAASRTIRWVPSDGSEPPSALTKATTDSIYPTSVSPDGKVLLASNASVGKLWVLSLQKSDATPQSFLDSGPDSQSKKCCAVFSPDGRWIAYRDDETGRREIYATPYPGPGGKFLISTEGGIDPVWARNGRELFYSNSNKVMAVDIQTSPVFTAGKPKVLFEGNFRDNFDVSPDGKRFLMIKLPTLQQTSTDQLTVVLNWFEELRLRVPVE